MSYCTWETFDLELINSIKFNVFFLCIENVSESVILVFTDPLIFMSNWCRCYHWWFTVFLRVYICVKQFKFHDFRENYAFYLLDGILVPKSGSHIFLLHRRLIHLRKLYLLHLTGSLDLEVFFSYLFKSIPI